MTVILTADNSPPKVSIVKLNITNILMIYNDSIAYLIGLNADQ